MLEVGTEAPDFTLRDQNREEVLLSSFRGVAGGAARLLPAGVHAVLHRRAVHRSRRSRRLSERPGSGACRSASTRTTCTRSSPNAKAMTSRCCRTSGRTVRVAQTYDVFNEQAGFANRGTFLIDTEGVIRFAEMNPPGEGRDAQKWRAAIEELVG